MPGVSSQQPAARLFPSNLEEKVDRLSWTPWGRMTAEAIRPVTSISWVDGLPLQSRRRITQMPRPLTRAKESEGVLPKGTGAPPWESGTALWPAHHGSAEPPVEDSSSTSVRPWRPAGRSKDAGSLDASGEQLGWVLPSISEGPDDV